jgi:hypothetical protein
MAHRRWAAHNVRIHTTGVKLIHHPVVGDLELPFESFPIPAAPSQSLLTYTTEPGSPSHDALSLLASWATSPRAAAMPARTTTTSRSRIKAENTTRAADSPPGPTQPERGIELRGTNRRPFQDPESQ